MSDDTADQIGSIEDCLYSIGNRVAIAKVLIKVNEPRLLETQLEDIARTVQEMMDEHCIVR